MSSTDFTEWKHTTPTIDKMYLASERDRPVMFESLMEMEVRRSSSQQTGELVRSPFYRLQPVMCVI